LYLPFIELENFLRTETVYTERILFVLLELFFHVNICFVHSTKEFVPYCVPTRENFPEWIPAFRYFVWKRAKNSNYSN